MEGKSLNEGEIDFRPPALRNGRYLNRGEIEKAARRGPNGSLNEGEISLLGSGRDFPFRLCDLCQSPRYRLLHVLAVHRSAPCEGANGAQDKFSRFRKSGQRSGVNGLDEGGNGGGGIDVSIHGASPLLDETLH